MSKIKNNKNKSHKNKSKKKSFIFFIFILLCGAGIFWFYQLKDRTQPQSHFRKGNKCQSSY